MNRNIRWGLIIQGPVVSYGQGPNNVDTGFFSLNSIETNITNFSPYVSKIIVSTWKNSGLCFQDKYLDKVVLIENELPVKDSDNRIKQFTSTYNGAKYLAKEVNITHILKIRTDQIVDPKIIEWLNCFFEKYNNSVSKEKMQQEGYLVFSDMMKDNPFYMGDFIFAGKANDIVSFCKTNLQFKRKNIHPLVGHDYILKYLLLNSNSFWNIFYRKIPLLWQISNNSNKAMQSYWIDILKTRMAVIPSSFFWSIIWRDRLMSVIIPDLNKRFIFYEDWEIIQQQEEQILKSKKVKFLIPTIDTIQKVKYAYNKYWRARIKFYYKKMKSK